MAKVQVKRSVETLEEVEVTFPIYYATGDVFDEGGAYDAEHRIDADGFESSVTRRELRGGDVEWEFSRDRADVGYIVGKLREAGYGYVRQSSADAFEEMHAAALSVLQSLATPK